MSATMTAPRHDWQPRAYPALEPRKVVTLVVCGRCGIVLTHASPPDCTLQNVIPTKGADR